MRYIAKHATPPPALTEFLDVQLPIGVNLDYDQGFTRKRELRGALVEEQFGLCGYTGAPVDDRIAKLTTATGGIGACRLPVFIPHTEHLKPRRICREELISQGKRPGHDLGEDMDYHNMIAALLVNGTKQEKFGAAAREDVPIPVWPTHSGCDLRFQYSNDGTVKGTDNDAENTVQTLKLNHDTLCGWRQSALEAFLDTNVVTSRKDLQILIDKIDQPNNGKLVEFSFVIKSVASAILGV